MLIVLMSAVLLAVLAPAAEALARLWASVPQCNADFESF